MIAPKLVLHHTYSAPFGSAIEVADFTMGERPAFRVECHCRNCGWKSQARFVVGSIIPLWLLCPKCECEELAAHNGFAGRDELTAEEAAAKHREWMRDSFKRRWT